MKTVSTAARVGLFFILGVALIYYVYTVIGDNRQGDGQGYALRAEFDNLATLTPGAEVRLAGVRIGSVTRTELIDGMGVATLEINEDVMIPTDSVARVAMASLLGQNYIEIDYGQSTQATPDGATIATAASADINAIMSQVQELGEELTSLAEGFQGLGEFGGEDLTSLLRNANELVVNNRENVDVTLTNLREITDRLNRGEGTLGRLLTDDSVYLELESAIGAIEEAAGEAQTLMADTRDLLTRVEAGEGTIGRLLNDDTAARELEVALTNLREFSETLSNGEGTIGRLLNDDELYRELQSLLTRADQALDGLSDSGPASAIGSVATGLF